MKSPGPLLLRDDGLTLVEVLVALVLIGIIYMAVPDVSDKAERRHLETAIDNFDRATRFASNEAVLRNTVVRMRFLLEKNPIEYVVEYGPKDQLILPTYQSTDSMSLKDQEKYGKDLEKFNKQFNKVAEYEEVNAKLEEGIRILGIGSSLYPKLVTNSDVSIYFYPTGERDSAIILCANDMEIANLEIQPFTEKTTATYTTVDTSQSQSPEQKFTEKAEEIYKTWRP